MSSAFTPGLLHRLDPPPRKVAVLRASRLGDLLCTQPALKSLRAALPGARVDLVTLPILRDLVDRMPYVDHFVAFPGYPGIAEQLFQPANTARFFVEMQAREYDVAVQMQGSGVNANPFVLMWGAGHTAGFVRSNEPAGLLDAALALPQEGHESERVLALTRFLGAPKGDAPTDFPLWPEDHRGAQELIEAARMPLIGIHPTARDPSRRWPLERFAAVAARLAQRTGGSVLVLSDAEGASAAAGVAEAAGRHAVNLAGRTRLAVLGAVISRLDLLITNDSGPAHMAYALGTPTLTVLGAGDSVRYGPLREGPFRLLRDEPRSPSRDECPPGCLHLERVEVDQVLSQADDLLREPAAHRRQAAAWTA